MLPRSPAVAPTEINVPMTFTLRWWKTMATAALTSNSVYGTIIVTTVPTPKYARKQNAKLREEN